MRLQRVGHDWVTELNWEIYTATVLLSVHQRNRTNRIYQSTYISIYRYRYTEGDSLGRTRLHDCGGRVLQSDICKLEPHETWKTENQGANGTNLCPKPQEVGILISESKRKISQLQAEIKFAHSPPFFFFLFKPPLDWMMPICIGGGWSSVYWFKCQSLPETTSQTHPEMILYLLSEHLLALSSWHKKFNSYIEKYAQESGRKWGFKTWLRWPMLWWLYDVRDR